MPPNKPSGELYFSANLGKLYFSDIDDGTWQSRIPDFSTHSTCKKQIEKLRDNAPCCDCTKHECIKRKK